MVCPECPLELSTSTLAAVTKSWSGFPHSPSCFLINNEAVVVKLAIFYLRDRAVMPTFWGNENTVFFKLIFRFFTKSLNSLLK